MTDSETRNVRSEGLQPGRVNNMTEVIAAKKATACVSDRVYVSHPAETAVVCIDD